MTQATQTECTPKEQHAHVVLRNHPRYQEVLSRSDLGRDWLQHETLAQHTASHFLGRNVSRQKREHRQTLRLSGRTHKGSLWLCSGLDKGFHMSCRWPPKRAHVCTVSEVLRLYTTHLGVHLSEERQTVEGTLSRHVFLEPL